MCNTCTSRHNGENERGCEDHGKTVSFRGEDREGSFTNTHKIPLCPLSLHVLVVPGVNMVAQFKRSTQELETVL